jgi:hypothetical protein
VTLKLAFFTQTENEISRLVLKDLTVELNEPSYDSPINLIILISYFNITQSKHKNTNTLSLMPHDRRWSQHFLVPFEYMVA